MKGLLRRIPGLATAYRQVRVLAGVVYERWLADPQQVSDRSHLRREWNLDKPAVRERNGRILAAIAQQRPVGTWGDALEIGCAEALFTVELAKRCNSVTACDISPVACERAAQRCARDSRIRIEQLNVVHGSISRSYDLVFVMDVLESIHGRVQVEQVVAKLAHALRTGGLLVFSATRLPAEMQHTRWAQWLVAGGDNLVAFIDGRFGLRLVHMEQHPELGRRIPGYCDHLIAVFEKT